jgi:hypothetical protein
LVILYEWWAAKGLAQFPTGGVSEGE